jgi:hypothetical protein
VSITEYRKISDFHLANKLIVGFPELPKSMCLNLVDNTGDKCRGMAVFAYAIKIPIEVLPVSNALYFRGPGIRQTQKKLHK